MLSEVLKGTRSMNNRLIVEAYKHEGAIRKTVSHGIATPDQKTRLKGLQILVEAKLADGTIVPKGSIAYFKEEDLFAQPWAKKLLTLENSEVQFIIVDLKDVAMIKPNTAPEVM